jgi:hypothetical protein
VIDILDVVDNPSVGSILADFFLLVKFKLSLLLLSIDLDGDDILAFIGGSGVLLLLVYLLLLT